MASSKDEVKIDCGACHGCCHQLVSLEPEDMVRSDIRWALDPVFDNPVLKRRPDGACVYLDNLFGCTIYDRRPVLCRVFDCGDWYLKASAEMLRSIAIEGSAADRDMLNSGRKFSERKKR